MRKLALILVLWSLPAIAQDWCGQDASQCRIACMQKGGNVSRCMSACQRDLAKCKARKS